jgi:hypothetical protein
MSVRMGSAVGKPFPVDQGVKQGDPLSPLLFGLLIDRIEAYFKDKCPEAGAVLGPALVAVLLYADDLTLPAKSPQHLQTMFNHLEGFCNATGLVVNVLKTEVMEFQLGKKRKSQRAPVITFNGNPLPVVNEFLYLGVLFDNKQGSQASVGRNTLRATRAGFGLDRLTAENNMINVRLNMRLFHMMVKPVLGYGGGIWGPEAISAGLETKSAAGNAQGVHLDFLRRCLAISKKGQTLNTLYAEFREFPVHFSWVISAIQIWNEARLRPTDDLLRITITRSWELFRDKGAKSWAGHLHEFLGKYDIQLELNESVPKGETEMIFKEKWMNTQRSLFPSPDDTIRSLTDDERTGFRHRVFWEWFWDGCDHDHDPWWYTLNDKQLIKAMAKLRLGTHNLEINTGRWEKTKRSARVCKYCEQKGHGSVVGDEVHMVFECPQHQVGREQLNFVVMPPDGNCLSDSDINAFFNGVSWLHSDLPKAYRTKFWVEFSSFVVGCFERREKFLLPEHTATGIVVD